jgi:hypothetical protein
MLTKNALDAEVGTQKKLGFWMDLDEKPQTQNSNPKKIQKCKKTQNPNPKKIQKSNFF